MLPSLVSNPYLRRSIILILNWWIFVGTTYYTWFRDKETPIILVYLRQEFQILEDTCQGLRFCVHVYYLVQVLSHSYQVHEPMYLFGKKKTLWRACNIICIDITLSPWAQTLEIIWRFCFIFSMDIFLYWICFES